MSWKIDLNNASEKEATVQPEIEPIPNKTNVRAIMEEAKRDANAQAHENDLYISVKWDVLEPDAYKGRKVFQKLRIWDSNEQKAARHQKMLLAMDAQANGEIRKKALEDGEMPGDLELASLQGKIMVIKLGRWDIDDKKGNYVMSICNPNINVKGPLEGDEIPEDF